MNKLLPVLYPISKYSINGMTVIDGKETEGESTLENHFPITTLPGQSLQLTLQNKINMHMYIFIDTFKDSALKALC